MGQSSFNLITQMSLNDEEFKKGIANVKSNVKDLIKGVEGATGNIQEMRKALMTLKNVSFAGKTKEEIKAIQTQIGKLTDEIGDARAISNAYGVELGTQIAGSLQLVAAGAEVATGAIALFGGSTETIEKMTKVMTILIGVTQALGVIEDALATRKLQTTALRIKDIAVTGYETAAKWLNTTATAANAAAVTAAATVTSTASIATKAAAAATWLWNAALLANPIVLIAAGIIAAAAAVYLLVKAFSSSDDAIDKQKEKYKQLNDEIDRNLKNNEQLIKLAGLNPEQKKLDAIKLQITLNQQRIKDLEKLNGVIAEGIRLKDDSTSEETTKNLELQKKNIEEINKLKGDNNVLDLERKYTQKDTNFLLNEELGILEKQRQNKLLNKENTSVEDKRISEIKSRLKLLEEQKKGYEGLTESISKQEKAIKDILATGGSVTPEMLRKYETEKLQLQKISDELETIANLSNRIKPITLTNKQVSEIVKPKEVKQDVIPLETKKLEKYGQAAFEAQQKLNKLKESSQTGWESIKAGITSTQFILEALQTGIGGITDAFTGLFEGTTGGFKNVVTSLMQGVQQIINALLAQAVAAMIAGEAHKGLLGLAFAAVGVAGLIGLWKAKVPNFAQGGVVPGSSYSGDRVPIMANSGEMILNYGQQASLFSMINNGIGGNNQVRFEISGDKLIGVLGNYTRKINSIR